MQCDSSEQLQREYGESTVALGSYTKCLDGKAKTSEHHEELARLERLVDVSRQAFLQHKEQHRCRREY